MPPKKKLRVIDTNQRKITSMLQQGPELTQDAPASADSESAFSSQNLVTTALRNRLGTETCDQLMRVKLETPNKMKEFEFTDALLEWRKVKDRIIFQKTADQEN